MRAAAPRSAKGSKGTGHSSRGLSARYAGGGRDSDARRQQAKRGGRADRMERRGVAPEPEQAPMVIDSDIPEAEPPESFEVRD